MTLADYIAIGVIALIIGGAAFYIIRAKRAGVKCIGCPHAKQCKSKSCTCGCSNESKDN